MQKVIGVLLIISEGITFTNKEHRFKVGHAEIVSINSSWDHDKSEFDDSFNAAEDKQYGSA
jgi:hypothetical protein